MSPRELFSFKDFEALFNFEISSNAQTVSDAIDSVDLILPDPDSDTSEYRSDLVMRLASLLRSQPKARRLELKGFHTAHRLVNEDVSVILNNNYTFLTSLPLSLLSLHSLSLLLLLLPSIPISSVLSVPPVSPGPVINCLVVLDPLSTVSQKLSPLLGKLKELLPLNITVLFNPVTKLSALPLKE